MKRYKIRCHDCDPEIVQHDAGKWVRYTDVESLRAELAACRALLMNIGQAAHGADENGDPVATLKAIYDAARKGEGE